MNLPWEAQLILAGVVGLLVGLLVMWLLLRQSQRERGFTRSGWAEYEEGGGGLCSHHWG